jgi:hypothetical protein
MRQLFPIFLLFISGCGEPVPDYFPLGNNLRWEYSIQETVNNKTEELKSIIANLPGKKFNDTVYYPRRSLSGETYLFRKTPQAIYLSKEPDQSGDIVFGYPLEQETGWQANSGIYILERRHESFSGGESFIDLDEPITLDYTIEELDESVEVPAGRFTGCIRIKASGKGAVMSRTIGIDGIVIEQIEWYAPGTGLVKRVRKEFSVPDKFHGEFIQVLVSIKKG